MLSQYKQSYIVYWIKLLYQDKTTWPSLFKEVKSVKRLWKCIHSVFKSLFDLYSKQKANLKTNEANVILIYWLQKASILLLAFLCVCLSLSKTALYLPRVVIIANRHEDCQSVSVFASSGLCTVCIPLRDTKKTSFPNG